MKLALPAFEPKLKRENGNVYIFDALRKKYVVVTPEEWVRQHFINYLVAHRDYPRELLANEVTVNLNNTIKRCDTVVYNRFLEPLAIIEYKASHIELTKAVFEQILRYNMVLHVKYLMISNGIRHICCKIDYDGARYEFLPEIPRYRELE